AQITWQLAATWRWSSWLGQFQTQLATRQGFVPWDMAFAATGRPTAAEIAATSWTFPDISIVLAPAGQVRAIVGNPDPEGWQPFNPRRPEELPRLPGVDYGLSLAALAKSAGRPPPDGGSATPAAIPTGIHSRIQNQSGGLIGTADSKMPWVAR